MRPSYTTLHFPFCTFICNFVTTDSTVFTHITHNTFNIIILVLNMWKCAAVWNGVQMCQHFFALTLTINTSHKHLLVFTLLSSLLNYNGTVHIHFDSKKYLDLSECYYFRIKYRSILYMCYQTMLCLPNDLTGVFLIVLHITIVLFCSISPHLCVPHLRSWAFPCVLLVSVISRQDKTAC